MAHLSDGRVIFVPLTAPGDRVRVRVVSRRKGFARGELVSLLEPGPSRCEPRCAVFGRCGGCAWQHLAYGEQVAAKRAILRDALVRIGGGRPPSELTWTPSPAAYGYRGRARLLVAGGRAGYRERRSHRLCSVAGCPVLAAPLEAELARLVGRLARAGGVRGAPPRRTELDGEWEIAMGSGGETRASRRARSPGASAERPAQQPLTLLVAGDEIAFSPGTFCQANALLLEALGSAVRRVVGAGDHLLELYAGAGFFTLGLARDFRGVVAVEAGRNAVADLRHNLAAAGRDNVRVLDGRVEQVLGDPRIGRPDVVFLDPPRVGLDAGVVAALARLGPRRIVYLSCDPATLARDVGRLGQHGYRLGSVEGFDLFPQTPHVEALVELVAADQGSIKPWRSA